MRNIKLICLIVLCGLTLQAQNISDALNYSQNTYGSSARLLGVGGAMGALGADFGMISVNPAGLASFRRSEMMFSPSLHANTTEARLKGDGNDFYTDEKSRLAFENMGLVIAHRPADSKLKTFNFALGFNKTASFNSKFSYTGDSQGSIADRYVEISNGLITDDLSSEAATAYNAYIIDLQDNSETQYLHYGFPEHFVTKEQVYSSTGSINEMLFSMGFNLDEKLMVGASVGIPFISYSQDSRYIETTDESQEPISQRVEVNERLNTSGVGFNFKAGLIYRASQMLRLGAAIHSPSSYFLTDDYSTSIEHDFDNPWYPDISQASESFDGVFNYKLKTPWKVVGSIGTVVGRYGFIGVDVEWLDYKNNDFNFTSNFTEGDYPEYEIEVNNEIEEYLGSAVNVRLGGELAINKLRLRAGYNLLGSPHVNDDSFANGISGGIGIREDRFYLDLGIRRMLTEDGYLPYVTEGAEEQLVNTNSVNNDVVLTLGFKF